MHVKVHMKNKSHFLTDAVTTSFYCGNIVTTALTGPPDFKEPQPGPYPP